MKVYVVEYYYDCEGYSGVEVIKSSRESAENYVLEHYQGKYESFKQYERAPENKYSYYEIFEEEVQD